MIEVGAPTMLALGPGIISIFVVVGTFAAAGMYAIGKRAGRRAQDHDAVRGLLPLLSDENIADLIVNDPSPSLLKALEYEIIRRRKDNGS